MKDGIIVGKRSILSAAHLRLFFGLAHAHRPHFHPNKVSKFQISSPSSDYDHSNPLLLVLLLLLALIQFNSPLCFLWKCFPNLLFRQLCCLPHPRAHQSREIGQWSLHLSLVIVPLSFLLSFLSPMSCLQASLVILSFAGTTMPVSKPSHLLDGHPHLGHCSQPRLCHHRCHHHPGIPGHRYCSHHHQYHHG